MYWTEHQDWPHTRGPTLPPASENADSAQGIDWGRVLIIAIVLGLIVWLLTT
jgi:hypothetical protein